MFELQQLHDLIVEHTSPPVKPILHDKFHPLREQLEAYTVAQEQDGNEAAEIKSEFLKLKQEKAAVDVQLQKIKQKDTRVEKGPLFEHGSHVGGTCPPVGPIGAFPVQVHKRMVNLICADSRRIGPSDVSPEDGRGIISRLQSSGQSGPPAAGSPACEILLSFIAS